MKTMNHAMGMTNKLFRTAAALWLLSGCAGGAGDDGGKSEELVDGIPSLPTRTGTGAEDSAVGPGAGTSEGSPAASLSPLQVPISIAVQTVSACATSDLDMVLALVAHDPSQPFIATVENGDGTLLGSVVLDPTTLTTQQQTVKHGLEHQTEHPTRLTIPGALRAASNLAVNLYACIDTNRNGRCAEEKVKSMKTLSGFLTANLRLGLARDLASDVIYFAPTRAYLDGDQVRFARVTSANEVNAETQDVMNVLNNLVPKSVEHAEDGMTTGGTTAGTIGADNPLTIRVAIHAPLDTECHESTVPDTCYVCMINPANFPTSRSDVRTNGCFVAGTRIELPGGETVPVEKLAEGMEVSRPDGSSGRIFRVVAGPELEPIVDLRTEDGQRLRVTQKHPMVTERGFRKAKDLKAGDRLFTREGKPVAIRSLHLRRYQGQVYNFELQGVMNEAHQVLANGLVSGDLHLQELLSR